MEVTLSGVFMGLGLGTLLALGDLCGGKAVSGLIRGYVEIFRGSPLIVQLFISQYTVPALLSIQISPYITALQFLLLTARPTRKDT